MIISQQGQRFHYDVLVIGGGVAGLSYILSLLKTKPNTRVALVCKSDYTEANSYYAQGGIAAVTMANDTVKQHAQDTQVAGAGLCNENVVKKILTAGSNAITALCEQDVKFAEKKSGEYDLAQEGGHSQRRIFHCGDRTGQVVTSQLIAAVKKSTAVDIFESHIAVNIIQQNKVHMPGSRSEVIGAYILAEDTQLIHTFLANAVVLATGGAGKTFRYTSNPETATGDGIAMAYRAGARVGNMEFYQFHPTLLYNRLNNNFLISEALRGEGAKLISPVTGKQFMQHYDKERMELATRDVIARAIFTEIERHQYNYVYLDIRHQQEKFLQQRFPQIYTTLAGLGINMAKDLIPVVPAAHYCCGGVLTDENGQSDLKRLYVIGESAFTGLHGANRLASNSLLECMVMGQFAAEASTKDIDNTVDYQTPILDWDSKSVIDFRRASQINAHWRGLRGEMSSYAGIIRTEAGLQDLLKLIQTRREMIDAYYWRYSITKDLLELRNIVLVAELIVRCALMRRESRGCHYREDYADSLASTKETLLRSDEMLHFR